MIKNVVSWFANIFQNKQIKIPVSLGELADKMNILSIKINHTDDLSKLEILHKEYNALFQIEQKIMKRFDKNTCLKHGSLYYQLRLINMKLWDIEDKLREKEANQSFDQEFIDLARQVYLTNDHRNKLKNEISQLFTPNNIEIKFYNPKYTKIIEHNEKIGLYSNSWGYTKEDK